MPLAAPVITARLPSSLGMGYLLSRVTEDAVYGDRQVGEYV